MEQKKSLMKVMHDEKRIINDIFEIIKAKIDKNYILKIDSPQTLKRNKALILRTVKERPSYLNQVPDDILLEELQQQTLPTNGIIDTAYKSGYILNEQSLEILKRSKALILREIQRNDVFYRLSPAEYLDQVPDDILLEELQQQTLPTNGIIYTAFQNGYKLNQSSSKILIGKNAKIAILEYIKMQNELDSQSRISQLLECLDESLILDSDFIEQLVDLAIQKGYEITVNSPTYLKQNERLAENYYKGLFDNNNLDGLLKANILSPELIKNKNFLQKYINLLSKKGIDSETIISTLTYNKECIDVFKNDIELFQLVFEQIQPSDLNHFFKQFFNDEELKELLTNQNKLSGKLLRISQLYAKDSTILESLKGELLGERYQNIPNYKMQLISKDPEFQSKILGLSDYKYILYSKMAQLVSQKTDRWNRFEENIINNLLEGHFEDLVNDLYEQAKQGHKITSKEIEVLTLLFSNQSHTNIFNITSKKELDYFEEIKELVCDTILTNPSLDDVQLTTSIDKYLKEFKKLSELDRMKLALLEKYYNMNLSNARDIVEKFSVDIDNMPVNNEYQASIVEQIRAIKSILGCNDINTLSQVARLDILVQSDLSLSTYLIEQTKEMFEQEYKENLYMPRENDKIGNITFNGKNIDIFDANTDFSMIVKRITIANDNNSQEIWNSMTNDVLGTKILRFRTCMSYMTDENILKMDNKSETIEVILGFAQGINDYSFDASFADDAHSTQEDCIYNEYVGSSYMLPSTLVANTKGHYHNELVINTLGIDEKGQMKKLQPDYIIYIKDQREIEDLDGDIVWEKSKKVASEFGIPIVIIDKEKIKESEKAQIASMSKKIQGSLNSNEVLKFVKKVEHYISRYDIEDILEYVPKEKMDFLKEYLEQRQLEEKESIAIPDIDTSIFTREQSTDDRQNILRRQTELREVIGEGR